MIVVFGSIGLAGVAQKLLLVAAVLCAGLGMHRLAPSPRTGARYFAGVLYALNPFVYDRIWAGQWFVLLGYGLLPWGVAAFLRLVDRGGPRRAWAVGVIAALTGAASPHMLGLLVIACIAVVAARLVAAPGRIEALRRAASAAVPTLLLSLYWLLPTPALGEFLENVDDEQLALYATVADDRFGLWGAVAGLQGFWNNPDPVADILPAWPLLAVAIVALALYGLGVRARSPTAWALAAAGAFGFLLALGTGSTVTRGAFEVVVDNIQSARGFREPQKGVALVALAYAYLGSAGVEAVLAQERRRRVATGLAAVLVALPALYGHRTLGGLWGRMQTSEYPAAWSEARDVLRREGQRSRVLFLPWSGYVELSFADARLVANPSPHFFATPVLASRSIGGGAVNVYDPTEVRVRVLLADRGRTLPLERCLARLGVGHVLVANEVGAEEYAWLARRPALRPVLRRRELSLYRLRTPGGLVMEERGGGGPCGAVDALAAERVDPAHVRVDAQLPPVERTLLGLQDPARWRVADGEVRYGPWTTYRRNYLVGVAALLAALVLALRARRA